MVVESRNILPVAAALSLALAGPVAASDLPGPVPARVERVVDGDTVRVAAEIWVAQTVSISVRLRGVDAPELIRPKCPAEKEKARAAKAFVEGFLAGGEVSLMEIEHDKYGGRVVARIERGAHRRRARRSLWRGQAVVRVRTARGG